MLIQSQPLDPEFFGEIDEKTSKSRKESPIVSQRMGYMFDKLFEEDRKIKLSTRISWMWRRVTDLYYNIKWSIRNHIRWHRALSSIRPWDGCDGMITVMKEHLQDYLLTEVKYGHSHPEYKKAKMDSVRDTVNLLERMRDSHAYLSRRQDAVESHYPKYLYMITEHEDGSVSYSGDFIDYDAGFVGTESGSNPQEGYFELIDGRFELVYGNDLDEVARLLNQIKSYYKERQEAYDLAQQDSDNDFEKLKQLLQDNMYSWWD